MSSECRPEFTGTKALDGKTVVVAGGAGFIGRRFCRAIADAGGRPIVADRDADRAVAFASELQRAGLCAAAAPLNITNPDSVARTIESAESDFGRIAAVVNCAYPRNQHYGRKLEEVTYADFCENVSLHLGGSFLIAQRFGEYFTRAGGGTIVNVSSIYGVIAPRFEVYEGTSMTMPVEYAAVKSAVIHLTRYLARYFRGRGIRVNCLSPGGIEAGQPAAFQRKYSAYCSGKGMLDATDLCGTLVFLLSDASLYVNGQNIIVDDGYTL